MRCTSLLRQATKPAPSLTSRASLSSLTPTPTSPAPTTSTSPSAPSSFGHTKADTSLYFAGDTSPFWTKVRHTLAVNPTWSTGNPLVRVNRTPEPASRDEAFSVPASRASDVAENPYWRRDVRRNYPKTEVLGQHELAALLVAQGGFTASVVVSRARALARPSTDK